MTAERRIGSRDWPASWHRALCARLADEVPGLRIDYWRAP